MGSTGGGGVPSAGSGSANRDSQIEQPKPLLRKLYVRGFTSTDLYLKLAKSSLPLTNITQQQQQQQQPFVPALTSIDHDALSSALASVPSSFPTSPCHLPRVWSRCQGQKRPPAPTAALISSRPPAGASRDASCSVPCMSPLLTIPLPSTRKPTLTNYALDNLQGARSPVALSVQIGRAGIRIPALKLYMVHRCRFPTLSSHRALRNEPPTPHVPTQVALVCARPHMIVISHVNATSIFDPALSSCV
ncbi:hypothetical protein P280DRAFT_476534 [Massarina eburnea CBS 473.64]|uniref:Uncharacterized protein n=1 Tax=Massarina eburnea CBS 473.64 TaxID=1395130 RepID=A0A6A6SCQ7_9PLEO|nr:hypothetical protein P280DRAFT_476534 [Massarina eburnea CBS 473.64]